MIKFADAIIREIEKEARLIDINGYVTGEDNEEYMRCRITLMNTDLPNRNGRIYSPEYGVEKINDYINNNQDEICVEFNPYESGYPMCIINCPSFMIPTEFEDIRTKVLYNQPVGIPTIESMSICRSVDEWDNPSYERFEYLLPRGYPNYWILDSLYIDIDNPILKMKEKIKNEYRKYLEETKYRGIKPVTDFRPLSVQWLQRTKSHRNHFKYDSRRLFDDMGK